MWFVYALLQSLFLALVNYLDEYLSTKNNLPSQAGIHDRVGGQLLTSCLTCFLGALILWIIIKNVSLPPLSLALSLFSSLPLIAAFAVYFYLLLGYSIHQVAPMFQLSSAWLILFDALFQHPTPLHGLIGITALVYGSLILDSGTLKFRLPSNLLILALPGTLFWAASIYLVRIVSSRHPGETISFWQLVGCGLIGILLLFLITPYRRGLLYRLKNQGRSFLGLSLANETFSQSASLLNNLAVSLAPVTAYVTAASGMQSLFLLLIVFFFPLHRRNTIQPVQWAAILLILLGTALINL